MIRRLTLSVLILLSACAGAQDRGPPPPKGPPMDEIASAVGLKDTQRASVQSILEQHHAAMMALHDAMRAKHDALDQQLHTSLAKVMTPDQLSRFESWQQTHRPPPPPDGPGGRGGQDDRRGPQGGPGGPGQGGYGNQQQTQGPGGPRGPGGGQGRRPPPADGQYAQQGGRPPPPPGNDWNDGTQNPPPPAQGGQQ